MYSTIYKIPTTLRKHTIYLRTETSFLPILFFSIGVHGPFPVVNSATSFSGIDLNLREHRVKVSIF